MKADTRDRADAIWENGWSGHEQAQRRRLAALSLPEKLRWLEEAHDLVRHLEQQPVPRGGPKSRLTDVR